MNKDLPLIVVAAVLAITGEVALKEAMNRFGALNMSLKDLPLTVWHLLTNPLVLLALVLYAVAVLFWMAALSRLDLSYAYPIFTALGFILVTVASRFYFHEAIPVSRVVGVGIICVGLFVIARGST